MSFLVERGQQKLCRALAHGKGGMIGELLVDFDGLGIAVGVVIDGSQRQLCQAGNLFVATVGNLFQVLLGAGIVTHIVQGHTCEVAGDASGLGEGVLAGNVSEIAIGGLGAFSCGSKTQQARRGGCPGWTNGSIVLLNGTRQFAPALLVTIVYEGPTANDEGKKHDYGHHGSRDLGAVLYRPGNGFGGRCPKRVLLKLMSSVTAHE